jgi:hypothetical protein
LILSLLINGSKGFGDSGGVAEREALEVLGMALRCWGGVLGLELGGAKNWGVLMGWDRFGESRRFGELGADWSGVGSEWARCWSWMWS